MKLICLNLSLVRHVLQSQLYNLNMCLLCVCTYQYYVFTVVSMVSTVICS